MNFGLVVLVIHPVAHPECAGLVCLLVAAVVLMQILCLVLSLVIAKQLQRIMFGWFVKTRNRKE